MSYFILQTRAVKKRLSDNRSRLLTNQIASEAGRSSSSALGAIPCHQRAPDTERVWRQTHQREPRKQVPDKVADAEGGVKVAEGDHVDS